MFNHPVWGEDSEGLGHVLQGQWSWILHRMAGVSQENTQNSSKMQRHSWLRKSPPKQNETELTHAPNCKKHDLYSLPLPPM